jgi:DNA-binding MarR family transcriptional regulator
MTAEQPPNEHGRATADRVVTALNKLAIAMRTNQRERSGSHGLHPTQAQILTLLAARPTGLRLGQLAAELGVTSATTSDSVSALERKRLVRKSVSADDARAIEVNLTVDGRIEAAAIADWPDAMLQAVDDLSTDEQAALLRVLVKMIRSLQDRHAIPAARMCVTCQYFDPYVHASSERPHHCRFVDAPFGDSELRLDCVDHQAAQSDVQQALWARFTNSLN